jgi:hypothetical protein
MRLRSELVIWLGAYIASAYESGGGPGVARCTLRILVFLPGSFMTPTFSCYLDSRREDVTEIGA